MKGQNHSALSRRDVLHQAVEHIAHLLPAQGPIGVFIHHNPLHALGRLPFERAVVEASQLFGTEPYMSEAAYRRELARGRIHIDDITAVLESEPDTVVFPGLTRRSLRRAMITPGVARIRRRYDSVAHRTGRSRPGLPSTCPAHAVRRLLQAYGRA